MYLPGTKVVIDSTRFPELQGVEATIYMAFSDFGAQRVIVRYFDPARGHSREIEMSLLDVRAVRSVAS